MTDQKNLFYFFKSPESRKRWQKFKKDKKTVFAGWGFLFLLFLSLTAGFWANNKPLFLLYEGKFYFPTFIHYTPVDFSFQTNQYTVDYKSLPLSEKDFALWPLIKWDPFESNKQVEHYPASPSWDNWLGTDDRGRDVLARLIYGFRYSIGFAFMVWLLSYIIGVFFGALMGFVGGKTDLIFQRLVEILETLPWLLLLMILVDVMEGGNFFLLVCCMAFFRWFNISYYTRAEFLQLRKREFVEICRAQGMGNLKIMFKHIFPNALTPVLTFSPFSWAMSISSLAVLDYLGFGLPPPTPSWGELLSQAEKHFTTAWWLALFPSLALFTSLVFLIFIGDGIRNAFDSRKA